MVTQLYDKAMSWDERFSQKLDLWAAGVTADIGFYTGLASETEGPIVELAVGNGRVAIPVAKAAQRTVIGVDTSPLLLEQARERATEAGVELDLRLEDMCDLDIDEPAGLIYCPGRSLLHVPTWKHRRRLFERIAQSLRPDGWFAWNVFTFDHRVATALDGVRQDHPAPHVNRYDVSDNRVDMELDGGTTSLWWATKNEWLGLLDVAGLQVEALYGDFDQTPLRPNSSEYVFVTRLRL